MDESGARLRTGDGRSEARNARAILFIVCFTLFFGVFTGSAVAVVLPDIGADLSVDSSQLSWLMTGFLLAYGVAIPFFGRFADRYGARPLFILGIAVFSVGSLLSALAPNFPLLLTARIVQAVGGAAVPGLGMTLASRAYGPERRGAVLGIVAATIGAGGAVGPLLGGALSEALGWESIFFVDTAAALSIPFALRILPKEEDLTRETPDMVGGVALALMIGGALLVPSEGARSGWTSPMVVVGAVGAIVGLAVFVTRQRMANSPSVPREFIRNPRFDALVGMSFSVSAASLAPLIALPILLTLFHELSLIEVGLVMLPGAIATSVFGVLAGRVTDRTGAQLPIWVGTPLMLVGVLGLSTYVGSSVWMMAVFAGLSGAGFGLVNTPLAATVSRIVRVQMLASALSINSMLFFVGGSFGAAALIAIVTSRGDPGTSAFNPLHSGAAAGFSDAFLLLAIPVIAVMALSRALPRTEAQPSGQQLDEAATPAGEPRSNWVATCAVPWMPECAETGGATHRASKAS